MSLKNKNHSAANISNVSITITRNTGELPVIDEENDVFKSYKEESARF